MSDTMFCGECGARIPADATVCPSCAVAQDPPWTAPQAPDAPLPRRTADEADWTAPPAPRPGNRGRLFTRDPTVTDAAPWAGADPAPPAPPPASPASPAPPAADAPPAPPAPAAADWQPRVPLPPTLSRQAVDAPPPPSPPRDGPPTLGPRTERPAPGAGELAGEFVQRLQTPGVIAAATVGGIALLTCVVAGVLTAVLSPDRTLIGFLHAGAGLGIESLRLTVATTLASVEAPGVSDAFKLLPLVFAAAPVLGAIVGARVAAPRLVGMSTRDAVGWSAAGAGVFAFGMVVLALVANGQSAGEAVAGLDFSIGSVLLMSVVLVAAGATLGALRAGSALAPDRAPLAIPPVVPSVLRNIAPALVALGVLLAVSAVVGFAHLEIQSVRGQQEALTSVRPKLNAEIENVLFLPDLGIDVAGLAVLGQFDDSVLPVDDDEQDDLAGSLDGGKGRIFDYNAALPIFVFLPELLILLGTMVVTALYAGFATARRALADTQVLAAAWGALTGIVWAVALVILRALGYGQSTIGDSVFASALLLGTILGAVGGLIAVRPTTTGTTPARSTLDD